MRKLIYILTLTSVIILSSCESPTSFDQAVMRTQLDIDTSAIDPSFLVDNLHWTISEITDDYMINYPSLFIDVDRATVRMDTSQDDWEVWLDIKVSRSPTLNSEAYKNVMQYKNVSYRIDSLKFYDAPNNEFDTVVVRLDEPYGSGQWGSIRLYDPASNETTEFSGEEIDIYLQVANNRRDQQLNIICLAQIQPREMLAMRSVVLNTIAVYRKL